MGYPREERESLVALDRAKFWMPRASDMRYQWAVVVIALVDHEEMQELVLDAWGMCVPKKLFAAKFTELDQSESRLR